MNADIGDELKVVLIFVDGLGWGRPDPAVNPCHSYGGRFFGLPAAADRPVALPYDGWARPIDATLGIDGIPQSATGQTSLLAGLNAQQAIGRHLMGFPNRALRELLLRHSILKTLTDQGLRGVFFNAYRPRFFELLPDQQLRLSATTVTNLAARKPFFDLDDLRAGRCLYQEFTNRHLRDRGFDVPLRSPAEAGRILADRIGQYDFLLFEYFQTDKAGHSQDAERARQELRKLDLFLASLLQAVRPADRAGRSVLILLTSDHGNIEDLETWKHTRNPVPLMAWGGEAAAFIAEVNNISEVAPAIIRRLRDRRAG